MLAIPLLIWVCGAGIVYMRAWLELREYKGALGAYQAELESWSISVFVSVSGSRYHRETHNIGHPTSQISHLVAMREGLIPCKVCKPVAIRKLPTKPEKPESIDAKIGKANWTFGLVVLSWIGFFYLPHVIKERFVVD